jgi:hypothetical protein
MQSTRACATGSRVQAKKKIDVTLATTANNDDFLNVVTVRKSDSRPCTSKHRGHWTPTQSPIPNRSWSIHGFHGAASDDIDVSSPQSHPPGVAAADNETGWRMALAKLAAFVEGSHE